MLLLETLKEVFLLYIMLGTFPVHVVFSLDSDHPLSPSCFSLCPPMLLHSKKQIDPTPIWGRIGLEIW
jgi:hypothetical protein